MRRMKGIIIPMVTPFTADGAVDYPSVRRLAEYLTESGTDCLYVSGTTGENMLLTEEERRNIAEEVVSQVAGRVAVFIQIGANTTAESVRLAQHAYKIGADGIGCVTPSYFRLSDEAIIQHFCTVFGSVPDDFPCYLYNIPGNTGNDITPEMAEVIAQKSPNVQGIKYSGPDMRRFCQYKTIRHGEFSVLQGYDDLAWPSYVAGADGIVTGCAALFPKLFLQMDRSWLQGDLEKCLALHSQAEQLVWLIDGDISAVKTGLKYLGICPEDRVREPLLPMSATKRAAFLTGLEALLGQRV